MKFWEIIGWAYEADTHCPACARARFGANVAELEPCPDDSEGNPIHPMFAGDEHDPAGEWCGDCRAEIWEAAEGTTLYLTVQLADEWGSAVEERAVEVTSGAASVALMAAIDKAIAEVTP